MSAKLERREFITLLGGAAATWPLMAWGQQPKLPTIGGDTSSGASQWTAAFVQRLRELGWIEGHTVAIEYRWAEGRAERYIEIATEFVRLKVDVIVTYATAPVMATKQATSVIPIVSALMGDPVGTGLVVSLARPGGNVTGLSTQQTDLAAKRLEFLREVVPSLRRLAILANIDSPRARLRGAQGSRGRALCRDRSAREHQPDSHQHLGSGRATADDARHSGGRRSGRSDVLWSKPTGPVPARRRLCRQNPARREAIRLAATCGLCPPRRLSSRAA